MTKRTNDLEKRVRWALKATNITSKQPLARYADVQPGSVRCTDGYRLHEATTPGQLQDFGEIYVPRLVENPNLDSYECPDRPVDTYGIRRVLDRALNLSELRPTAVVSIDVKRFKQELEALGWTRRPGVIALSPAYTVVCVYALSRTRNEWVLWIPPGTKNPKEITKSRKNVEYALHREGLVELKSTLVSEEYAGSNRVHWFDLTFLLEALPCADAKITFFDELDPVSVEHEFGRAVVMPKRNETPNNWKDGAPK